MFKKTYLIENMENKIKKNLLRFIKIEVIKKVQIIKRHIKKIYNTSN